jgi:hypothetical protein
MTFWIRNLWFNKISWGKVLLTAAIFTVISYAIHMIEALLTMKYYLDPAYFGVWSKLMMPSAGPPPMAFTITSIIFAFVTGISIALIYYYLRDHLPPLGFKRAFYFADLLIATTFVFFTLPAYLMLNLPVGILVSWFVSSFVILTAGSWLLVKIVK